MQTFNEQDIIRRLHDPQTMRRAFEEIVSEYGEKLYWQIRRMVTYHDDANDVLQNTFLKAWNAIENFRGDSKLSTWLFKIAYNETLTFLSHQHETISIDSRMDNDEDDSPPTLTNTLQSAPDFDGDKAEAMLQAAIDSLPPKQRSVFVMKYFKEMKYEEISKIVGTSVGALKASYHHAVKKIEEFFDQHD